MVFWVRDWAELAVHEQISVYGPRCPGSSRMVIMEIIEGPESGHRTKLSNGSEFVRWFGISVHILLGQVLGLKSRSEIQWSSSKTLTWSFHGPIHGPDRKETVRKIPWLKSEYHFQYN